MQIFYVLFDETVCWMGKEAYDKFDEQISKQVEFAIFCQIKKEIRDECI